MTIYNINLGIGWASSGVEYAQIYRAKLLRSVGLEAKFIFMDFISADNIEHLTKNMRSFGSISILQMLRLLQRPTLWHKS